MLKGELEDGRTASTALYLKLGAEYFGFAEELPKSNSRGRTLHDARAALQHRAAELNRELEDGRIALTAVYLKLGAEYFGFIEELPKMNSHGRTLHDARTALQHLAAEMFAEERRTVAEAHPATSMVREAFFLRAPRPAGSGV